MKPLSIIQLILIAGCWRPAAYGQGNSVSKNVISKLTTFSANHLSEKAYLQFDKPYYAAGDTIYFKAYVTEGEQHRLSGLSGVLHVDLINTKNKIDQSIKLQLDSGVAWGDFALPDSLPKGNYSVRAYTRWMRNDDQPGFFDKIIPIGSINPARVPESIIKQPAQPAGLKPDVQFFPEGGSLVTGIRSKVAFKAVSANGLGIDITGEVIDNENKQVVSFASGHLGMGYFIFTPEQGKTYTAKINYPNGVKDVISLPQPQDSGIVLTVDNDSLPQAPVTIAASNEYFKNNQNKSYTLLIYSAGLVTTVSCKLDSPVIKLDILKRKLRTGVATVTLFSPENEPICERLIFIQNYDRLDLNIKSDKDNYSKREKVNIKLTAINRKSDPAEGHFSVSVIDESKVPNSENNADNILSYLLLTADLKGYIEQPAYYFNDTSAAAQKNLDVLMLTQGYRRFTWKQVLDSTKQTLTYQPEKGIEIKGQVTNLFNKPVANGTITLIPSKGGPVLSSTTDDKGMFRFSNLMFADTVHFVLSAVNAKNKNSTKITYFNEEQYMPAVSPNRQQLVKQITDTVMSVYARDANLQQKEVLNYLSGKRIMLKEIKVHDKKRDDQYRTQSFAGAGHADQVMHADEIGKIAGELSTSLDGRLHGVGFNGGVPYLKVGNTGPMLVIVDGVYTPMTRPNVKGQQLTDKIGINIINPNDVETVEVLKYSSASIYGIGGANGVLIITTKQGGGQSAKDIASIGVLPISTMGFYKAREFYSPKYDNTTLISKQQDLRPTIYWKPEIKTDKDGNASFEYYNADGAGTYKIVVEGIDKDGNFGRQVYRYKVE